MERLKITTVVGTLKRYDVEYECSLPAFIEMIVAIASGIPKNDRQNITVDWTDGNDCDSGYIEFRHWRFETDAEVAARVEQQKAVASCLASERERQERELLTALKAKYEPGRTGAGDDPDD